MAVKPSGPVHVKDFLPRLKRHAVGLILFFQVLILVGMAVLLNALDVFGDDITGFTITLVAQSVLGIAASLIVYHIVAKPIKNLMAALVHIAGEPTVTTPPNPNEAQFARNGLKPVLQAVYKIASEVPDPIEEDAPSAQGAQVSGVPAATPAVKSALDTALNQAICGFVIMNQQRQITYANQATPIRVDTNGVQSLDLLFPEGDSIEAWWNELDTTAVQAERTWPRIPNKLPNEEDRRFFDVIASYHKGTENEMVITLIDRTHLYEVGEEELDFIAFAAHELRGPITVIRGYIDVLTDELGTVLQEDQKELFRRLAVSANRLSGYINNILNTSRYDRRHLRMHLVETRMSAVYDTIRDDMALRASSQNRMLSVDIPADLPTIAADTASLGEVFGNLIDNAIKYSNEGGAITVKAYSRGDLVELAVEDHGIGMPSGVVSNLFQKFYRSHRSRETVAGTGIGLYISKAIIESHGGAIAVRSEDGRGSIFTISLPTYATVADKLKSGNNDNQTLIGNDGSWIKNHNMYRG